MFSNELKCIKIKVKCIKLKLNVSKLKCFEFKPINFIFPAFYHLEESKLHI